MKMLYTLITMASLGGTVYFSYKLIVLIFFSKDIPLSQKASPLILYSIVSFILIVIGEISLSLMNGIE